MMINCSLPCDNETGYYFEFSKEIADVIFDIKVAMCSIGILLSLFATGLIILFKFYKKFVYRLVMYLMVVNIMQAVCIIAQMIPIEVTDSNCTRLRSGQGWREACAALSYLHIVVDWIHHLVIIWIMLYMLKLSWQLHHLQSNQQPTTLNPRLHKISCFREIAGSIFLIFSPFLICWFPFVMNMYGISGPWCFIKTIIDDVNHEHNDNLKHFQSKSLTLMMVLYYIPVMGTITFVLISIILIIAILWKSSTNLHGAVRLRYKSSMKQIGFMVIYPLIYCLFCLPPLINRVYLASVHAYTVTTIPIIIPCGSLMPWQVQVLS